MTYIKYTFIGNFVSQVVTGLLSMFHPTIYSIKNIHYFFLSQEMMSILFIILNFRQCQFRQEFYLKFIAHIFYYCECFDFDKNNSTADEITCAVHA